MAELQLTLDSEHDSLIIQLEYPSVSNLSYNFQLIVGIQKQQMPSMNYSEVYRKKFVTLQKIIKIDDLTPSCIYKVSVQYKSGNQPLSAPKVGFQFIEAQQEQYSQDNQSISVRDRFRSYFQSEYQGESEDIDKKKNKKMQSYAHSFSNSELMLKQIGQSAKLCNNKKLEKYILEGRKCRNIDEFINEKGNARHDLQGLIKRKQLLYKGTVMFKDIYKHRQGMQFFQNDWFMGPFYSYDQNEGQIKRN